MLIYNNRVEKHHKTLCNRLKELTGVMSIFISCCQNHSINSNSIHTSFPLLSNTFCILLA